MDEVFLKEIAQDIRQAQFAKLWERYKILLITLLIGVVIFTTANTLWQNHILSQKTMSTGLLKTAVKNGSLAQAEEALATISSPKREALAMLIAAGMSTPEEAQKRAAWLTRVYDNKQADPALRDFAAMAQRQHLEEIAKPGRVFSFSAQEQQAVHAWEKGEYARARELFHALADNVQTPPSLRERATIIAGWLEGK